MGSMVYATRLSMVHDVFSFLSCRQSNNTCFYSRMACVFFGGHFTHTDYNQKASSTYVTADLVIFPDLRVPASGPHNARLIVALIAWWFWYTPAGTLIGPFKTECECQIVQTKGTKDTTTISRCFQR